MREKTPLMVLAIITLGIQVAGSATVFAQDNGRNSGRPHGGWVVPCSLASIRLTIRASSAIPPPPDPMASSDRRARSLLVATADVASAGPPSIPANERWASPARIGLAPSIVSVRVALVELVGQSSDEGVRV
jgi:hypothetical protein